MNKSTIEFDGTPADMDRFAAMVAALQGAGVTFEVGRSGNKFTITVG